jgi:hypothetical protein
MYEVLTDEGLGEEMTRKGLEGLKYLAGTTRQKNVKAL